MSWEDNETLGVAELNELIGDYSRVPREINSGAIMPDPNTPGSYMIDANTSTGLRKFRRAEEVLSEDVQSDEPAGLQGLWLRTRRWKSKRLNWEAPVAASNEEKKIDDPSPETVLNILKSGSASHKQKRMAIIESEILFFPPRETENLSQLLLQFITAHRHSNDAEDFVAVAAAVRKYVSVADSSHLSSLATILEAARGVTPPLGVELEVTKTVVRRLVEVPPEKAESQPELAERLIEISRLYITARQIPRERYGAIALNAVLALCLLRSSYCEEVIHCLEGLNVSWFLDLVCRRAGQLEKILRERFDEDLATSYVEKLAELSSRIESCLV